MKQQQRFAIFHATRVPFHHIVWMPVREDQVYKPVIVKIEVLHPESAEQTSRLGDVLLEGDVREGLVMVVAIDRSLLLIDVGDEQIFPSIYVEISRVDSHAGPRLPIGAECGFRL